MEREDPIGASGNLSFSNFGSLLFSQNFGDPAFPQHYFGRKGGYFQKLSNGSETLQITSEGLGDLFQYILHKPRTNLKASLIGIRVNFIRV